MGLPLRESRLARKDLDTMEDQMARDNPAAAFRLIRSVRITHGRIARWPHSGRLILGPDYRVSPVDGFPDHLVVWRVTEKHADIYRVIRGRFDHQQATIVRCC